MARNEETFLLVSLEQNKAKKLAQVINNDTCRMILDSLAKKDSTETDLANELRIPISTVHYNLQNLLEAGLVKAEEFHYSEKGKEVNHYSLTNKFIIIAPKSTEGLSIKIKRVLPVALIGVVGAAVVQFFSSYFNQQSYVQYAPMLSEPAKAAITEGAAAGGAVLRDSGTVAAAKTPEAITQITGILGQSSFAVWFIIGVLFSLSVFILWEWVKERLER